MRRFCWGLALIAILCNSFPLSAETPAETPAEIYQRLVIPLIQSAKASSCSQCHLQGLKLDDFLTADPKASFAALRARGWIDTKQPSESKLLQFIAKKPENSTALMDQVRQAELDGIGRWIQAAVKDPDSLDTPSPKLSDLTLDEKLIRHARQDHVVSRFVDVVWSQLERCANCHSPDRNAKQVEKHGEQMSWIVPNSPHETLQLLEQRQLINLDKPLASPLKTKALGQDEHGGGIKFPVDGQTDRAWAKFLTDYAAIRQRRYAKSSELPGFDGIRTWRTGLHLRITDLPTPPTEQYAAGQYAVLLMHRIQADGQVDQQPVAMGEGRVSQDGSSWSTTLVLLEPSSARGQHTAVQWDALLTEGRYQLRWLTLADSSLPLEKILTVESSLRTDIDSLWKSGHGQAKKIAYSTLVATKKPQ